MKIRLISGQGDQKEIEFDGDQKKAAESYLLQDWPEKWKIVEFIDPLIIERFDSTWEVKRVFLPQTDWSGKEEPYYRVYEERVCMKRGEQYRGSNRIISGLIK